MGNFLGEWPFEAVKHGKGSWMKKMVSYVVVAGSLVSRMRMLSR